MALCTIYVVAYFCNLPEWFYLHKQPVIFAVAEYVENVLKELKGEKIGYQSGTMGNWYIAGDETFGFPGFPNIEGVGNASLQFVAQDVAYGRLFAVITDELPAKALVESINELN